MLYTFYNVFHNTEVTVELPNHFVGERETQREVFERIEHIAEQRSIASPLGCQIAKFAGKLARIRRTLCPSGGYPNCMCGIVRDECND